MIQYYSNRELSEKLQINLAKWKRWSREFLPPDVLGGFQSGYARQYTIDDAFWVFLGGHLVKDLHLSIPESKRVLRDLRQWLHDNGFTNSSEKTETGDSGSLIQEYIIAILHDAKKMTLCYQIRGMISKEILEINGIQVVQERYIEDWLFQGSKNSYSDSNWNVKNLFITGVLRDFVTKMEIPAHMFQTPL
jgi:hypothetical protein